MSAAPLTMAELLAMPATPVKEAFVPETVTLSDEQQYLLQVVGEGRDAIVDATVGSGKTTAIQHLCSAFGRNVGRNTLYLTYSKLLKLDAQARVRGAKVQNFHGIVYPFLLAAGIRCGISESIGAFNRAFEAGRIKDFPRYDLLVVDEYQDLTEEYAALLRNIKSLNPAMQVVLVGDMAQKVRNDTLLDVPAFVGELTNDAVAVPFTQSFRMGPEMGDLLAEAWGKPVVGVNLPQRVEYVDYAEAVRILGEVDSPGQVLALGKRAGAMSDALNEVEKRWPTLYNKKTVYASIRDADSNVTYGPDTAVFTTFDSSKGLERPIALVFDYDEEMWGMRLSYPNVNPVILRNIFLVAASRGKERVIFVRRSGETRGAGAATLVASTKPRGRAQRPGQHRTSAVRAVSGSIGFIPTATFRHLPDVERARYPRSLAVTECFDFKYAENVAACFALLETTRLDDGQQEVIEIDRTDGLIDLSPVVGNYQEAQFFNGYNASDEALFLGAGESADSWGSWARGELKDDDDWHNCLVLTAARTQQLRYFDQVTRTIEPEVMTRLHARLAEHLSPDDVAQLTVTLSGRVGSLTAAQAAEGLEEGEETTSIEIVGVIDAVRDGVPYELKFTSELGQPMFLQLALYLVMGGFPEGVLWNTRTGERWSVKVPDTEAFLDAVVLCFTKQDYRRLVRAAPASSWMEDWDA